MKIKKVSARAIEDSRGEKTIEVSVNGVKASSPTGKSTGKYESKPYHKNIDWVVKFLNSWNDEIIVKKFDDLKEVESKIKKKLKVQDAKKFGGDALFAFESAILKALAKEKKTQLWKVIDGKAKKPPVPIGNCVGGGLHSASFDNHPDFQEFLVIPKGNKFSDNVRIMNQVYSRLGKLLESRSKNDEGAWQTSRKDDEVLDLMYELRRSGLFETGVDAAATTLYKNNKYKYRELSLGKKDQVKYIANMILNHEIFYIEDPFEENDFESFAQLRKKLNDRLIVGDDLTATQINRVKLAIKSKSINAVIIKPNQNGSLLELKEIFDLCKKNNIKTILSHRSAETMDDAIADYAFGFGADYFKCGVSTKWRTAKLNRMMQIERSLKKSSN